MLESKRKKKIVYAIIGTLISCLVFGIAGAVVMSQPMNLGLMGNSADQTGDTTPTPTLDMNASQTKPDAKTTNISLSTIKPLSGSGLLTEEEALKIAMPLFEQYAAQSNRVIASVNSSYCSYVIDVYGSRTDHPSPFEPNMGSNETSFYPQWCVKAFFEPTNDSLAPDNTSSSIDGLVYGYCALIWADNGQIRSTCPLAWK